MVEYKCQQCQKTFNKKSNYNNHLNRKIPCEKLNISIEVHQNSPIFTEKKLKKSLIFNDINNLTDEDHDTNNVNNDDSYDGFRCKICEQTFTVKRSLDRHLNYRCKGNTNNNLLTNDSINKDETYKILLKEINKLKKENKEIKKQFNISKSNDASTIKNIDNNIEQQNIIDKQQINNTVNNNQSVNITIVPYGKEDLSYITDAQMKEILNKGFKAVEHLVHTIHFNKEHPENHNICIRNIKDTYVVSYNGQGWVIADRDDMIQDMYDDRSGFLVEQYKKLKGELDGITTKKFERYINEMDEDKVANLIKKELKLSLYNNRSMIKKIKLLK